MLEKRVIVVTGKGGVGKTTVAIGLALRAAARGKRVLLCESTGAQVVAEVFGVPSRGYEVQELSRGFSTLSITAEAAIEDYVLKELRFKRLYNLVFKNRVMGPFMDAVPGLHDLVHLGKIFDLERERDLVGRPVWDLIVLDAPATGHGLTMLASPRAMMDMTVTGPFYENARLVADLFEDPTRTALVLVSLPEDMPVNETLDLHQRLGGLQRAVAGVVLNEVHPPPVPSPARYAVFRDALLAAADDAGREAIALTDGALRRNARETVARDRLKTLGVPVIDLPFLFHRGLRQGDFAPLAAALEAL